MNQKLLVVLQKQTNSISCKTITSIKKIKFKLTVFFSLNYESKSICIFNSKLLI